MAKCSELLRVLVKAGWTIERQIGSHIRLTHADRNKKLSFPNHGSEEMPKGTMRAIFRQAGMLYLIEKKQKKKENRRNIKMAKIKVKVEKTTTGFSAYAEKYAAFYYR